MNRTQKFCVRVESMWLHSVCIVSGVLKVGAVETSVDLAV